MKGAAKRFKSYPSIHHPLRYQTSQGPACQVTCSLMLDGNPWISAGHPPKRMCFRAFCLKQMAFSSSVRVTTGLYTTISVEDVGSTMANWEFYVGPQWIYVCIYIYIEFVRSFLDPPDRTPSGCFAKWWSPACQIPDVQKRICLTETGRKNRRFINNHQSPSTHLY